MKFYNYAKLGIGLPVCLSVALMIYYYYILKEVGNLDNSHNIDETIVIENVQTTTEKIHYKRNDIVIAVVACGDRLHETLNMIKSALMFSKEKLHFIVVAEEKIIESFSEKLGEWKAFTNNGFTFKIFPPTFPKKDENEWKTLFKPCAAQRLFLPSILEEVDSILYMDTDTLFLTPVEEVWKFFYKMNASQMAALAPEHEDPNVSWYNRFAKHPYYGKMGLNSGVMLMNLTRMRLFKWGEYVVPIYKKFKLKLTWGDQDIINIIFHYHPGKLLLCSCRYNYRPDHCMYMSVCKPAEKYGVAVIHGSRGFFHSENQPVFQSIYRAFEEFPLGGDLYKEFYQPLENYLEASKNGCGHFRDIFLKNIREYIDLGVDKAIEDSNLLQ